MNETLLDLPALWTLGAGGARPGGLESQPLGPAESSAGGTTQAPGGQNAQQQGPPPANPFGFMLPFLLGIFILFIFMSIFAGRKEKKRREQMLHSLTKHDRVQTTGGLIGTIVELKDDEITLKVDESTNTRIRFARSAVTGVLKSAAGGPTATPS